MGTTAQKLQRVLDTKEGLKDTINTYLGQDITSAIPFKDYETYIKNFYNSLPKTDYAEGSNITLENTLKGKLDFEDGIVGYGDTKQNSYSGKNLYPSGTSTQTIAGVTFTPQEDGSLKLNGTSTYSNYYVAGGESNYVQVENLSNIAETVTLSVSGIHQEGIQVYVVGATLGPKGLAVNGSTTFTTTLNDTYRIFVRVANGTVANSTIKIQLEKGSSATSFEKYVGGTASPNPNYPQEVKVVKGKNRLDDSNLVLFNSNKYISTTNYTTQGKIELKPSTTYTLIYKASTISDIGMWEFDSSNNKTTITYTAKANGNYHIRLFTTLSNTKTMSFYAGSSDTFTSVEEFLQAKELMILEGDYSSQAIPSYLPYNTIGVKARGKNHLLCRTDIPIGFTRTDNGITWQRTGENTFKLNGTASGNFTLVVGNAAHLMENLKTGETYTLSGCPSGGSDSTYRLQIYNFNGVNTAYDTGSGATFVSNIVSTSNVAIRVFDGVTINNLEFNLQIELGSTKTSFIPFEVTTKQLSLGDKELAKISTYVDTFEYDIDEDKVYLNKPIRKKALNGGSDEDWAYETTYNRFALIETINDYNITLRTTAICNYYRYGDTSIDNYFALSSNGKLALFHAPTNISTLAEWKTWLSTNKLILYYILATAVKEEITGTLKEQIKELYNLMSYTGTTILEVDGDLPLIIKTRALKGE